jgi:hypothetical protein
MQSALNKRRAIGILVVLSAVLVMLASWNAGENESI